MLITFLSPTCDTCHYAVDALNSAKGRHPETDFLVVVVGIEPAARAFLNIYPLEMPAIRDDDRLVATRLGVNVNPFALLYGSDEKLRRKALLTDAEQVLEALLTGQSCELQDVVFPAFLDSDVSSSRSDTAVSLPLM